MKPGAKPSPKAHGRGTRRRPPVGKVRGPARRAPSTVRDPGVTPDFAGRLQRLMDRMRAEGLDHLLVTNPVDVGYLTGFLGGDSYLVVGPGVGAKKALIITDGRYEEELAPQRAIAEILVRDTSIVKATASALDRARVQRCGYQSSHLSVDEFEAIASAMGAGRDRLTPAGNIVGLMREIKDDAEIALMQTATKIQEAALLAVLPTISPGQSELDIAALIEMEMKRRGSTRAWFDTIVGARANGALPHYRPATTTTQRNKLLLIDWGATYRGYAGDMTRTFALGAWPAKMREVYEIVREAQETSAAALAPGKSTHEIDGIARRIIERYGYAKEFNHGLGHGLGMAKERPYLNPLYPDMRLEVGHVVTVEPGIYLPGVGGVRIEDLYVITANGAKNLCSLPKTLEWSTL